MTALRRKETTVPVQTMENIVSLAVAIVPDRDKMAVTSLVKAVISPVRDRVAINHVREVTSLVKEAISPARDRAVSSLVKEAISPVRDRRVDTSPVKLRAATSVRVVTNHTRSLMASLALLIRRVPVSIRQTMIPMPSTA